jgi:hypothetical protein
MGGHTCTGSSHEPEHQGHHQKFLDRLASLEPVSSSLSIVRRVILRSALLVCAGAPPAQDKLRLKILQGLMLCG